MKAAHGAFLAVACALAPPILLAFGAPPGAALVGCPVVWGLGRAAGAGRALALVLSCAVSLALYTVLLRATGWDEAIYYRPHERFATWGARLGHRAYQPGVRVALREPYGDLQILTPEPIAEPREVVFRTDSEGFRNDADYDGEPWILVGDSFVVGVGNSQEEILQARLAARGVRAYNLGHPGGPLDYEGYWRSFRSRHGGSGRLLLFLYEGNDFPETVGAREQPDWWQAIDHTARGIAAPFTRLATYRVTRSLLARIAAGRALSDGRQVRLLTLAGAPMAFLEREVAHARAPELEDMALTDASFVRLAPELAAVFFVPTKYRVYQPWVAPEETLPDASWRHLDSLCREQRVPCFDLTPALVERSRALLPSGLLTWWRDDTHWNGEGIDAAAQRVADAIAALGDRS